MGKPGSRENLSCKGWEMWDNRTRQQILWASAADAANGEPHTGKGRFFKKNVIL